jgi:single-strand DNA-binding protein
MNHLVLLGVVLTPPALKTTSTDKPICTFSVAIRAYRQEDPSWGLNVCAWGKLAVGLAGADLTAGTLLILEGGLRIEKGRPAELQLRSFHVVSEPADLPGVNSIALAGHAGRDPEMRYFESGSVVANLTLAVNRRSRDEDPDWFNLEVWGKPAEVAADYVRKGSLLGITGSVGSQTWADRATGEERSKIVVRVDRLDLLGSKRDNDSNPEPAADEEIPF